LSQLWSQLDWQFCNEISRQTDTVAIFTGERGLVGCSLDLPSTFIPRLYILLGEAHTLYILPSRVPPSLPRITPLSCSINLLHCAMFHPINMIIAFSMSKPSKYPSLKLTYIVSNGTLNSIPYHTISSKYTFLDYQTEGLASILSTFTSWPCLAAVHQMQLVYTLPFSFMKILSHLLLTNIQLLLALLNSSLHQLIS